MRDRLDQTARRTYQVDPDRIVLVGRSAGGQIALFTAYSPGNPALPTACPTGDTSVRAVIALYAPVDQLWGYTHPAKPDLIQGAAKLRNYLGGTPDDMPEIYRLASPNLQVTSQTPPTLIIHGGHDRLVSVQHASFLHDALEGAGVPNRLVILPWADHGFDLFFDGWGSQIVQPIIRDFLAANLGNGQSDRLAMRLALEIDRTHARPEQIPCDQCQDREADDRVLTTFRRGEQQIIGTDTHKGEHREPGPAPPPEQAGRQHGQHQGAEKWDPARNTIQLRCSKHQCGSQRDKGTGIQQQPKHDHAAWNGASATFLGQEVCSALNATLRNTHDQLVDHPFDRRPIVGEWPLGRIGSRPLAHR